ncbi:MAG TPA: sulfite exporter TauE/SafE family protein [Chitinophagales bacterium]|nr:sulfite exporter TauE/SafE family protein [Chitinophagales bacterium]
MDILNFLVIFLAGIAVAFINTISAAGSLVSLSAFMFIGLSSVEANATNRIPIIFQSWFSAKGFESKGVTGDSYKWWLAAACVPGAIIGALWAVKIPADIFNKVLAGVMLLFLFITLVVNPLKPGADTTERVDMKHKIAGIIIYFFIGIYGGFIQAGSGFFLMAPMLLLHRFGINKTNYYKVSITLIYTIAALAIFLWKGNINWYYGAVMSTGTSLGGWLTSRWSVTVNEVWMKRIMVTLILALTVYVWFFK